MADARRYTGGKYLKAALIDRPVTVTISDVSEEEVGEDKERKLVVYFREFENKGLALNTTNTECLIELFGPETDEWKGKQVTLYSTPVQFAGKTVQGLRLRSSAPVEGKSRHRTVRDEERPPEEGDVPF